VKSSFAEQRFSELEEAGNIAAQWPTIQGNNLDIRTRFIFQKQTVQSVLTSCAENSLANEVTAYALTRWTRWMRHDAWMERFLEEPAVERAENPMDKQIDFSIEGVPFDLKVTRFPRAAERHLTERELAIWLYINQSKEGRFHLANRLFVVADDEDRLYNWQIADGAVAGFMENRHDRMLGLTARSGPLTAAVIRV